MEKQYDILATLFINDEEDGGLIDKVQDVFTTDVYPTEEVLDKLADSIFEDLKNECLLNTKAVDIDIFYRLDLVYLQDDYTDDEDDDE